MSTLNDPSDPLAPPFEEKGYTLEAFMPRSTAERTEFRVVVRRGTVPLFAATVPMLYPPRFGVDVGDLATLEEATDRLLRELPPAADFTPGALDVLRSNAIVGGVRLTRLNEDGSADVAAEVG